MQSLVDPASNLVRLIRCPSVTPAEAGALAALEDMLTRLGFEVERPVFSDVDTPPVENLFAKSGSTGPHLAFAGHTDVVPAGEPADWSVPPFSGEIRDGAIYGRGAVDMKGGIACFVAALARHIAGRGALPDQVSLLITGDEEGPAVNGMAKLLKWAEQRGERYDACLVGEPTNPSRLGEMIKIGRRGSLSGLLTVTGRQGHVAYPHLALNPLPGLMALVEALVREPLDAGNERFQPSNLEITSIDTGNPSVNVIPARAGAAFNVRFNDEWTPERLKARILERLAAVANAAEKAGTPFPAYDLAWRERPSPAFLTRDDALTGALGEAILAVTGRRAELSTTGGTSDARFIRDYCPVVEFGLVGKTMHMADERVPIAELEGLTEIYGAFIARWFAAHA